MDDILKGKALFIDFDSTFVKVETIDELAKFSLKDDPDSEYKVRVISHITNQAMCGEISFPDALEKRFELLSISRDDVKAIRKHIASLVSNSFIKNKELIQSISDSIWILSGGFREIITPIVSEFGINKNHVLANSFIYNENCVSGCDKENYLSKDKGKVEVRRSLLYRAWD